MALSFIPKEEKFFGLFEQQAGHICEAARTFKELADHWSLESPHFDKIRDIEHEADITTHEIIDKLNRTFVTPFDREDIHTLASKMDDVVDLIQSITNRMHLYRLNHSTEELSRLSDILWQATETVRKAVGCLKDLSKDRRLLDYCIEINRLENTGDRTLENALQKLFAETKDPIEIIKWKEIYEVTEIAIDKCEDVANALEGILVKQG